MSIICSPPQLVQIGSLDSVCSFADEEGEDAATIGHVLHTYGIRRAETAAIHPSVNLLSCRNG